MSAREYYKMGLSLNWKMTVEEAIAMLEEELTECDVYYAPGEVSGIYIAIALMKGEA